MTAIGRDIVLFASRLDREQSAKGMRLGENDQNDTWQAAVALRFGLTLVTDETDFELVPQVKSRNYIS